jgi:hypothetical protein
VLHSFNTTIVWPEQLLVWSKRPSVVALGRLQRCICFDLKLPNFYFYCVLAFFVWKADALSNLSDDIVVL